MGEVSRDREISGQALTLLSDSCVADREFGEQFAEAWRALFDRALARGNAYLPPDPAGVLPVDHSFAGVDLTFRFDQTKMADWFAKEADRRVRQVFIPKRLKRSTAGVLTFHESVCAYDPDAPELALTDADRNIMACALPGLPPGLKVVYGNKWVNTRFGVFNSRSLQMFLIQTDYVPAFLGSDLEICTYLFLMDYCIIREDYKVVPDGELCKLLHVFRPSPVLRLKGLA